MAATQDPILTGFARPVLPKLAEAAWQRWPVVNGIVIQLECYRHQMRLGADCFHMAGMKPTEVYECVICILAVFD